MRKALSILTLCAAACGGTVSVAPTLPRVYADLDLNLLTSQRCRPLTLIDETEALETGAQAEPISLQANVILVYSEQVTMQCTGMVGCAEQSREIRGRAMDCPPDVLARMTQGGGR